MSTPSVTLVTENAATDNLTEQDYRDIFTELRTKGPLDKFVATVASQYSKAWWWKYEKNDMHLTPATRNELRRAVGLPALPRSVTEVTSTVDPNAQIWQVGDDQPNRVILLAYPTPLTLRINGDVEVVPETELQNDALDESALVTTVTGGESNSINMSKKTDGDTGEVPPVGPHLPLRASRRPPSRWRDLPVSELAAAIRNRQPYVPRGV